MSVDNFTINMHNNGSRLDDEMLDSSRRLRQPFIDDVHDFVS